MRSLGHSAGFSLLGAMALVWGACGDDSASGGAGGGGAGQGGATTATQGAGGATSSTGGAGQGGGMTFEECYAAEGPGASGTESWQDGTFTATVSVDTSAACQHSYALTTDAPLRDGQPSNPRQFAEAAGQPLVRSGHQLFDALYALAIEESREASVDAISDFAFNNGNPIPCPPGGCFETGRLWKYVWTRDTAYSVALGLGQLDPLRSKNSLDFKLSPKRDQSDLQIVQDTGTGGSWPVSTDRVTWALGAWELLKYLDGAERTAFRDRALTAMINTAERDRVVVFDPRDGLYRGEQSFLDWREQTYPSWTSSDTAQIAMSRALGTNVAHLRLLEVVSKLADEKSDTATAQKYAGWADSLRTAIRARFWLATEQHLSSYIPGELDGAATARFDLLSSSLAVLLGAASDSQASLMVGNYPHLPQGAPVIWPQQQDVAIYHNRGIWPFVTAFWVKAAAKVGNDPVVSHGVRSLMRGAALNLSNMENFEAASGANWVDEGPTSGPVVNSQRQLWSVAGYLAMVEDVVFGRDANQTGIRFAPKLGPELRDSFFAGATSIALSNLRYRGKRVSVRVTLPPVGTGGSTFEVVSVRHNGVEIGAAHAASDGMPADNLFEVTLGPGRQSADPMARLSQAEVSDYRNVFGPKTPSIAGLSIVGDRIQLALSPGGEAPADIGYRVYRDGVLLDASVAGSATTFTDSSSAAHASTSYCYSVESVFSSSGNASQHSRPVCYWGPGNTRIQTFSAQGFTANGGALVFNHGRWHHENWGDPNHTLTVSNVVAATSGKHWIQVLAGNGAGGFTTGITCGVKSIQVYDGAVLVARGELVMPHLGVWSDWRDSNLWAVDLEAGKTYTLLVGEAAGSGNMSDLDHFSLYGGTGGASGRFNKVNIAELKLLSRGTP